MAKYTITFYNKENKIFFTKEIDRLTFAEAASSAYMIRSKDSQFQTEIVSITNSDKLGSAEESVR